MKAFVYFRYKGRNGEKVIAKLYRNKIAVFDIKKLAPDILLFKCRYTDEHKVFAIFDDAWYNIKKIRAGGALYPLIQIWKKKGALLGAAIFLAMVLFSGAFIFSVEVHGSGVYEPQVRQVLNGHNVRPFTLFSRADKNLIEKSVTAIEGVSFASYRRQGNRAIVEVRLTAKAAEPLPRRYEDLTASINGKVLSVTVIRGTKLVSEGDTVTEGQSLVGAYHLSLEEEQAPTYVMARVQIESEAQVVFKTDRTGDSAKSAAAVYSKFVLGADSVQVTDITQKEEGYLLVTCLYILTINGG